jgi:superfamily II DNA or RNA helicase
MASRYPIAQLTHDEKLTIRQVLRLQPEKPEKFTRQQFYKTDEKEDIEFWTYDGDDVLLPYTFASVLFKQISNSNLSYPLAPFTFTGQLYSHQIPVYQEAIEQLHQKGTTIIGLYPGFGKTVVGAALTAQLGLNVCVLVHREYIGQQWVKTFEEYTNASIYFVPTAEGLAKNPIPDFIPRITICMEQRWMHLPPSYRKKIGTLIIDEAHIWCTKSRVEPLLAWEPRYVIAETATLYRNSDGMEKMMQAICGLEGIFKISEKPFEVYKISTGFEPEVKVNVRGQIDYNALLKSVIESEYCNKIILNMIEKNPDRKILCLTRLKEHINILLPQIQAMGIKVDWFAGNKKSYSDSRVLLGTISKIGTGFDEKGACPDFAGQRIDMVILMTSIKDVNLLEQNVGRGFRSEFPVIIDLVHKHPTFNSHWYGRRDWYVSRNGTIQEVKLIAEDKVVRKTYGIDGTEIPVAIDDDPNPGEKNVQDLPVVGQGAPNQQNQEKKIPLPGVPKKAAAKGVPKGVSKRAAAKAEPPAEPTKQKKIPLPKMGKAAKNVATTQPFPQVTQTDQQMKRVPLPKGIRKS